jgi:hypothetical protein
MFELTRDTVVKHNIPRAALLRPPVQFGVGAAFQTSGVPQIGALAGPEYLVTVSDNGDLDKLDETLAARQIAWLADLATQLDQVPAAELSQGDPTLGQKGSGGGTQTPHEELACTSANSADYLIRAGNIVVDYDDYDPALHGVLLGVWTTHGKAHRVQLELRRAGRLVARSRKITTLTTHPRRLVLRPRHGHKLHTGAYRLIIRKRGRVLARRSVRVS